MEFIQRINFYALAFIAAAGLALWYGARHGMTAEQVVGAATAVSAVAAQFEKLVAKKPGGAS